MTAPRISRYAPDGYMKITLANDYLLAPRGWVKDQVLRGLVPGCIRAMKLKAYYFVPKTWVDMVRAEYIHIVSDYGRTDERRHVWNMLANSALRCDEPTEEQRAMLEIVISNNRQLVEKRMMGLSLDLLRAMPELRYLTKGTVGELTEAFWHCYRIRENIIFVLRNSRR